MDSFGVFGQECMWKRWCSSWVARFVQAVFIIHFWHDTIGLQIWKLEQTKSWYSSLRSTCVNSWSWSELWSQYGSDSILLTMQSFAPPNAAPGTVHNDADTMQARQNVWGSHHHSNYHQHHQHPVKSCNKLPLPSLPPRRALSSLCKKRRNNTSFWLMISSLSI